MSFSQKLAIVTGGASGIGLATAKLLEERGAKVVVWDIQSAENPVDITSNESIAKALSKLERVDILVHSRGSRPMERRRRQPMRCGTGPCW